jgi:hypothetical protein
MYERWFPAGRQSGRPLLLVAWDPADLAEPHLMQRAAGLGPVEEGVLMRDGGIVRRYYYRFARNYEYP